MVKEFLLGFLMGIGLLVFVLWRVERRVQGTPGCLWSFILSVIAFLIGAIIVA